MRLLAYLWALPVTILGLILALLTRCSGGCFQRRNGVVEACGGIVGWWLKGGRFHAGGAAMTLGHVILARDNDCLAQSRDHELFHVRQYERWGIFLLPAYWLVAVWLWLRGFHPYLDHPLEPPPKT